MTYCEYADGANNNLGAARVQRVPSLRAAAPAMRVPQSLGIWGVDRLWREPAVQPDDERDLGSCRIVMG